MNSHRTAPTDHILPILARTIWWRAWPVSAKKQLVNRYIDNENVTAVIFTYVPGQDTSRTLVEIMYREQSPSSSLPYTIARKS
jgi:hypothetical protein